jgi:ABC-type antimicrobial peptide transport system permease subunit
MGLESDYVPEIFIPYLQAPAMYWQWTGRSLNLVARSAGAPQDSIAALRAAVWEADRDLPVYNVTTLERMVEESTGSQKTYMLLLGTFAAVALALAAVGIYGVMSYLVAERTREIGVRIALGASGVDVLRLVLSRGMTLAALGLGLGLAGAFGLTRFLKGFLFGVQPTDPLTFAVVAGFLLAVAAVACWLPAQRATKVDPLEALRYE